MSTPLDFLLQSVLNGAEGLARATVLSMALVGLYYTRGQVDGDDPRFWWWFATFFTGLSSAMLVLELKDGYYFFAIGQLLQAVAFIIASVRHLSSRRRGLKNWTMATALLTLGFVEATIAAALMLRKSVVEQQPNAFWEDSVVWLGRIDTVLVLSLLFLWVWLLRTLLPATREGAQQAV